MTLRSHGTTAREERATNTYAQLTFVFHPQLRFRMSLPTSLNLIETNPSQTHLQSCFHSASKCHQVDDKDHAKLLVLYIYLVIVKNKRNENETVDHRVRTS